FIDSICQIFFFLTSLFKKLSCAKKPFHHVGRFDNIATIIFFTKRFYFPRFAVPPVWPSSVKPICGFEKMNDLLNSIPPFITADKVSVDGHKECHYTKATATACYDHLIICRIVVVFVKTFSCHTTFGLSAIREILKRLTFYDIK